VTDEAAFWAALSANPADNTCWLVFADWLEEADRQEAEYVRRFVAAATQPSEAASGVRWRNALSRIERSLPWEWKREFVRVWSARPLLVRVSSVDRSGRSPLGHPETTVSGQLIAGTLAKGQRLVLPLVGGGQSIQWVPRIVLDDPGPRETQYEGLVTPAWMDATDAQAGRDFNVSLECWGQEVAGLDIAVGGLVSEAPAEQDAAAERPRDHGIADIPAPPA
jgi:uncharacterized protein (TIGR02996 family)